MSVTFVLCLMKVQLWILSFSLTFRNFLSTAHWLVSSFFTNGFARDDVCHPFAIAGKIEDISFQTHEYVHGQIIHVRVQCVGPVSSVKVKKISQLAIDILNYLSFNGHLIAC